MAQYHSIIFGDKHTWEDWHLVPTSRPVFNPPTPKTKIIDIPGADYHLDLTEVLTGNVVYNPREGSFEFVVLNGYTVWNELYSEILNYLHGQVFKAILMDEPAYYYEGRFTVNEWKSEPHNSKIVINYTVNPYKRDIKTSLEDWEWDPFSFESGIIREYKDLRVDGNMTFIVVGDRMEVTPSFIVDSDDGEGLDVEFKGTTYHLPDGTSRVINIRMLEGENTLKFTGNGTVSIEYRGGRL